jgi:predicted kinase
VSAARPLAVVVAGRIASGKSTLARALADGLGAALLVADRIREAAAEGLAGADAPAAARPLGRGRPADDAVYAELLRRADAELAAGRSVVLDAAFPRRALRDEARALAARRGARFRLVECRADDAAVRARLAARAAAGGLPPERWLALRDAFDAQFEAPEELAAGERLQLDTGGPPEASAAAAAAWLAAAAGL